MHAILHSKISNVASSRAATVYVYASRLDEKERTKHARPCRVSWTALRTQVRTPGVRRSASKRANERQEWNY